MWSHPRAVEKSDVTMRISQWAASRKNLDSDPFLVCFVQRGFREHLPASTRMRLPSKLDKPQQRIKQTRTVASTAKITHLFPATSNATIFYRLVEVKVGKNEAFILLAIFLLSVPVC